MGSLLWTLQSQLLCPGDPRGSLSQSAVSNSSAGVPGRDAAGYGAINHSEAAEEAKLLQPPPEMQP